MLHTSRPRCSSMRPDIIIGSDLTSWQQPYLYDAGARKRKDLEATFWDIIVGIVCGYVLLGAEFRGNEKPWKKQHIKNRFTN